MSNSDKPLAVLARFAAILGWPGLRMYQHCPDGDTSAVTTWYESGESDVPRRDFFLQINEQPSGQISTYVGAVYALRYRICSGWHSFTLYDAPKRQEEESSAVDEWLHRRWYDRPEMRREFRRLHPECAEYSWGRIRRQGPPYSQDGLATA
jgi:hypothetical protein